VCAADLQAVLVAEAQTPRAAASRSRRHEHQTVAEQSPDGMARIARERGRDEAVGGALQERHLLADAGAQRVGIAVAPVGVDERALAQVADAAAAAAEERAERSR